MLNDEVRSIMTQNPVTVHPDDTIKEVIATMFEHQLQQLPVVKDEKLVGMITSYDLWRQSHDDVKTAEYVREIMNTHILKVAPKDKVGTAAELFIDKRFKTIPVVNLEDKLKGVVTAFDVIKYVMKKEYPHPILYKEELSS